MEPHIAFEDISKIYSNHVTTVAVEGVNFQIMPGEFISLVGRSGAGKSTLLKLLIAEERPTQGRVFFEGRDIATLDGSQEISSLRRKIGTVFQDFKLLSNKTVFENVAFAMEVAGKNDEEIAEDVPQVLELVGLSDKINNFPHELSGGEKQRVSIARALVHRPGVLVADEPTGNLDPANTFEIIRLLLKINEIGTTVVLATHNKEVINTLDRRVVSLDKGRLVKDDPRGTFIL
ncbi:cell division ATP-binding protein FtsE [Candidatus Parcubacteria bacterium]|nr:MAG: cell division ATP-binding protein FtsE [Candidatus Parcubacteria bacterium]